MTEIVFDFNETDIDTAVISYNSILHFFLDKHAPEKCKSFAIREEREWMTDEVQTVKRQKRKSERIWRTSKLVVHRLIYKEYCIQLNVAITYAKTSFYHNAIIDCNGDQRKLFKLVNSITGPLKAGCTPPHDDPASLSATFNHYFMTKIDAIRDEFPGLIVRLPDYFCPPIDTILEPINVKFL